MADIYSPAFRDHPSFAETAKWAIIFDVLGGIVLLYAIRRKLIVGLRIKKALKQGKIKNDDQMLRFENFYLGGQVMTKFAIVLLLLEDIPEGIITGHVIANTYCERGDQGSGRECSGVSGTAYFAIILSCTTFLVSLCTLCSRYESGLGDFGWNNKQRWRLCSSSLPNCKAACQRLGDCAEMSVASNGCCFPAASTCSGRAG